MRILAALALFAHGATAQEYVTAKGRLSDDDFYRLVSCAAPPGGACQKDVVRWSRQDARNLTVRLVQVDPGYPAAVTKRVEELLPRTLADINATGARVRLREGQAGRTADIRLFLIDRRRDTTVAGTGLAWFDGNPMQGARMQMGWRNDGTAIECAIAFSRDVRPSEVRRLLVEEIVQCLGLMTDIGGRYYESRSIFSELGDIATMGEQDIMALRRHYP